MPQICVYSGEIPLEPYLLTPMNNNVYSLVVGQYFTIDVLTNGVQEEAIWRVKGDIVGEYRPTLNKARLSLFPEQTKAKQFTGVCWRAGTHFIQAETRFGNFHVEFTVAAPQVDTGFSMMQFGQPAIGSFNIPRTASPKTWLVLAGKKDRPDRQLYGIEMTCPVYPFAAGGQVAFIQLMQTSREAQTPTGQGHRLQSKGEVLDDRSKLDDPYLYNAPVELEPQQQIMISMNDGPAVELTSSVVQVKISEQFRTFLMFRPAGHKDETTWVPLAVVSWGWAASASFQDNVWNLANPQLAPSAMDDLVGKVAQQAFPCWDATASSLKWQ